MIILEHEAKLLLQKAGLPIPRGTLCPSPEIAANSARLIGGEVIVKAQIPIGGRMKLGGIYFAQTPDQAHTIADDLLGTTLRNFLVEAVLVEERLDIATEVFLAFTYDEAQKCPVVLASAQGGIEIESAETIIQRHFSARVPFPDYLGRDIATELGFRGNTLRNLGAIITQLAHLFLESDALLLEVNPLILDQSGNWWVADVHLDIDEDALFRQKSLSDATPYSATLAQRRTKFEQQALAIDRADHRGVAGRLIPFKGSLGLLIGGGGASLTIMDALLDAGLQPANYCEIGGNPSVWKIKELTKLIISQPRVRKLAVIMNVVSNTRVDLVARGVIKGILELERDPREVLVAFRIPGSWEDEGQAILSHYDIPFFGRESSIDDVVEAIKSA